MPQISTQEFEELPLRVHKFLSDVPLHDAWVVDLPRSRSGIQPEPGIHQSHHRVRMRDGEHMLGGETGLSSGRVVIQFQSDGG